MIRSDAIAIGTSNGRYQRVLRSQKLELPCVATGLPWTKSPGNWTRRHLPMRA